ncbi:MFS transporter [Ensifer adhaerens]|uniref:MFS transporter n=1 Tax=Ensifer adhaerens TaxID=106592 RepID=UPI001CC14356|nr:MFS transporter [Ensifer adhaerens]MBZ7923433.1 MFS transporter [Ensifer adhaerens]UAX91996.1 MFS transporter [Ensifer adhaerens]UAX99628.1 MFS transporter [Ensifer adhaerens]UAY07012.1 MFS transporter [Ensifer adhaerens]
MNSFNLWGNAAFRRISLVLTVDSFCSWMLVAALPLIVAARFGAGVELVGSLALRLLPSLLLAPIVASLLRRSGPRLPVLCSLFVTAVATPSLAFATDAMTLQMIVLVIGAADAVITPGLLTLRAAVVPAGRNMEANTAFQAIDRFAKIFGPPAAGLAAASTSIVATLVALALAQIGAVLLLMLQPGDKPVRQNAAPSDASGFGRETIAIFRENPLLWALLLPAFGYMVSLGALQPFLFWLNRDQFHLGPEMWTLLLAAQGAGALIGAVVSHRLAGALTTTRALLRAYLLSSLFEGLSTFALIFAPNYLAASTLLIVGGIPEMVAFATYFTLVQRCLPLERQTVLYAISLPLMDACLIAGIVSGALYTSNLLSLGQFWLFASACAVLPVLPFLAWRRRTTDR